MNKIFLALLSCLSIWQVYAGNNVTCPDLSLGESTSGWMVTGNLSNEPFNSALISQIRVSEQNIVTCKYTGNLSLSKIGNFQIASNDGLWQSVNLGGLWFKQCLATLQLCDFYSA